MDVGRYHDPASLVIVRGGDLSFAKGSGVSQLGENPIDCSSLQGLEIKIDVPKQKECAPTLRVLASEAQMDRRRRDVYAVLNAHLEPSPPDRQHRATEPVLGVPTTVVVRDEPRPLGLEDLDERPGDVEILFRATEELIEDSGSVNMVSLDHSKTKRQRAERDLGNLHRCRDCGLVATFTGN